MVVVGRIEKGAYFDSVTLMTVGKDVAGMQDTCPDLTGPYSCSGNVIKKKAPGAVPGAPVTPGISIVLTASNIPRCANHC